mgnify:CR=1 FL=1|jgi:hypothetical protein
MPSKKQRAKAATAAKAAARATAATVAAPTKEPRTLAQMVRAEDRAKARKLARTGLTIGKYHEGCLGHNAVLRHARSTTVSVHTGKVYASPP